MDYLKRFTPVTGEGIKLMLKREMRALRERISKPDEKRKEDIFIEAVREIVPRQATSSLLTVVCEECCEPIPVDIAYFTRDIELKRRQNGKPHICGPHCIDCHGYLAFEVVNASEVLRNLFTPKPGIPHPDKDYDGRPF